MIEKQIMSGTLRIVVFFLAQVQQHYVLTFVIQPAPRPNNNTTIVSAHVRSIAEYQGQHWRDFLGHFTLD